MLSTQLLSMLVILPNLFGKSCSFDNVFMDFITELWYFFILSFFLLLTCRIHSKPIKFV